MEQNNKQLFSGFKYIDMHKPITWEVVAKEIKQIVLAECKPMPVLPENLLRLCVIDELCLLVNLYTKDRVCEMNHTYTGECVSSFCLDPSTYERKDMEYFINNVRGTTVGSMASAIYSIIFAMVQLNVPVDDKNGAPIALMETTLEEFVPSAAFNLISLTANGCDLNVLLSLMQEWANKQDIDIMPYFLLDLIYRVSEQ